MNTFLLPTDTATQDSLLNLGIVGMSVVLTVLGRLNEKISGVSIGGMYAFTGWTAQEGKQALMSECGMSEKQADLYLELLPLESHNDPEVLGRLFGMSTAALST